MIEEALVSMLKNDGVLDSLISGRVYAFVLWQGTDYPAITYQRISTARVLSHDQDAYGLTDTRFQINVYAESYEAVRDVVEALREAVQGYKGFFTLVSGSGVRIDAILPAGERDVFEPEVGLYHSMIDYIISHEE